jgi:hypothetical protein
MAGWRGRSSFMSSVPSLKNGSARIGKIGGQVGDHFLLSQSYAGMEIRFVPFHSIHHPTLDSL